MNIAIWGAGKFGQYVCSQLQNKAQVICFIDNKADESDENKIGGIPIVGPSNFIDHYADHTEIVLIAFLGSFTILEQIKHLGIKRFGFIHRRAYIHKMPLQKSLEQDQNILWNDDEVLDKVCMDIVETNVVDFCNMNCKGCSHFSNLFSKGSKIPFEIFERDIKQLSAHVFIWQFNLLGGEVLLSDRLLDYIACLKREMPKTRIELVSNGLLVPHVKKEVLEYIRDNEVSISITEYPPTTVILQEIKDRLDQYQIVYEIRPLVKTFGKNIDILGENDAAMAMQNCRESKCQFLRDGKLYKCPFAALGNFFFQHYGLPISLNEGLDIYDSTLNWKEEIGKLCNDPTEACRYCGAEERFPWERSDNPSKEEWLI